LTGVSKEVYAALTMILTKQILKQRLGIKTDADLARFFKCTRAAINLWAADKPIPELRQLRLRESHPELFSDVTTS
jgi:hypothetical protein